MFKNAGVIAKFLVGAATAVLTGLEPYYGSAHWFPAVTAGLGAFLVYLVPNTTTTTSTPVPPAVTPPNQP